MIHPKIVFNSLMLLVIATATLEAQGARPAGSQPTNQEEFSFRKAFLIANACEAAYMKGDSVEAMLRSMGVERYKFFDLSGQKGASDTQALAASIEGYTLICFRGTAGLSDWTTNLRISPKAMFLDHYFSEGSVHSGFWNAWNDVKPEIVKYLKDQKATNYNDPKSVSGGRCHEILIGGHSLGGAVALIAGIDLQRDGYQVLGVFTFGQPKVVLDDVAKKYSESPGSFPDIQRFIFADDPVPSLPAGYVHIGTERYSREVGEILAQARSDLYWPSVGDHSMANYVKTLSQLILSLSKSSETLAMASWLKDRKNPLSSYLGLPRKEAETELVGFTEVSERVRCRERN